MIQLFDIDTLCAILQLDTNGPCTPIKIEDKRPSLVHFNEQIAVIEIPSVKDFTRREKNALWHTQPAKNKTFQSLQCVLCGSRPDADDDDGGAINLTGIETAGNKSRFSVTAVLDEQENQRGDGCSDPTTIAKMYQQCCAHSAVRAQIRGMQHEMDIRDYVLAKSRQPKRSRMMKFLKG